MAEGPGYSLVQYTSDHSGYRCGYCKSDDTNYSHGKNNVYFGNFI